MNNSELREKDEAGLGKELTDLLKAQFGLRMQIATQQLSNTSQLKKVRRDIARVRTIMTEQSTKSSASKTPSAASPTAKKAGKQ